MGVLETNKGKRSKGSAKRQKSRNPIHCLLTRRSFLLGSVALLPGSFILIPSSPLLLAEEEPLDHLNPYGPIANYRYLRRLWDPRVPGQVITKLWKRFEEDANPQYGEWALIFAYQWWRMTPLGNERIRVAHLSRLMSEKYRALHPDLPAGHLWHAVHTGMEALSIGILNALHFTPTYRRSLEEVTERFPDYFFGGAYTLLAKGYLKLPPFPLSIGDLNRAEEYLEKARPYQERRIAFWYLVYAELELLRKGQEAARAMVKRMEQEITPKDAFSLYSLVTSLHDASKLLEVVEKNQYDRYQWDPVLFPIDRQRIEALERRYLAS